METGILYRIAPSGQVFNAGYGTQGGLIIKGSSVSINVLGSNTKPISTSDMVDIAGEQIEAAGAYPFSMLPRFIYINGTADSVELMLYNIEETLGAF